MASSNRATSSQDARHILRIAYYVLRDETVYDPARLAAAEPAAAE
jgi:hypothetical protein